MRQTEVRDHVDRRPEAKPTAEQVVVVCVVGVECRHGFGVQYRKMLDRSKLTEREAPVVGW